MRSFLVWMLLAAALSGIAGCRRKPTPKVAATIEDTQGELSTAVLVADPRAASQLLRGFYPVEAGGWRWTMRKFAVSLRSPAAVTQAATLELKFAIPDMLMQSLKSMTLTAKVNGVALPKQTYTNPGDQLYTQTVPASALKGEALTVEFELDKAFGPSKQDQRELGLVVTSVGLESK